MNDMLKPLRVFLLMALVSLLGVNFLYGQQERPGGKIRLDLANLPVAEAELKAELLQKGVVLDKIDPERLEEYADLIESVIQSLLEKGKKLRDYSRDTVYTVIRDTVFEGTGYGNVAGGGTVVGNAIQEAEKPKTDTITILPPEEDYSCSGHGIYGQHIFWDKSIEVYEKSDDVKAPDFYILGIDDELTITIYGISQADLRYTINQEGYISPEGMHRIFLKGLSFGDARKLLLQRFSQAYQFLPEQFTVRVTSTRNIIVNVFGEVKKNGSYTIPAINTAFNAIVAAGGPTDFGSVRNIQLIRNGVPKTLDVYEFLSDPSIAFDFQLEHNDIIYIPATEKQIVIQGAVNRPCRYELEAGETLTDLLDYAGGLKENANWEHIQVERFENNQKVLLNANLKELLAANATFSMINGDSVLVHWISRPYENFVTIKGEVEIPGKYALPNTQYLSELLVKSKLRSESRMDVAYLIRTNADKTASVIRFSPELVLQAPGQEKDLTLAKGDEVIIFSKEKFAENATVSITGAVRDPVEVKFDVSGNMRVQDLILLGGGLLPNSAPFGYIKRKDPTNKEKINYIKVDLFAALADSLSVENHFLKPFDQLTAYTREKFYDIYTIEIEGAVREPGSFDFDDSLRLKDIIYMSGGLKPEASGLAYILRSDIENPKNKTYIHIDLNGLDQNYLLAPMDYILVLDNPAQSESFPVKILGAVRNPGEYKLGDSLQIKDMITLAGGLKYEAALNHIDLYRMGVEDSVGFAYKFVASFAIDSAYNLVDSTLTDTTLLSNGGRLKFLPYDHLVVREVIGFEPQQLVKIDGEVTYPGYYLLTKENYRLLDLIKEAGGLTNESFGSGATLYRSKGNKGFVVLNLEKAIRNKKSRYNVVLNEGDYIQVPKTEDLVYIRVKGTVAGEQYPEKFLDNGMISVAYQGTRNAKWYVENFAAGFSKAAKPKLLTVEDPNHHIRGTRQILFHHQFPSVDRGATITVGLKPVKNRRLASNKGNSEVDWEKVFSKSLTSLTSVVGLIVLLNQVTK